MVLCICCTVLSRYNDILSTGPWSYHGEYQSIFWWRLPSFSSKRPNRFHTWADTLLVVLRPLDTTCIHGRYIVVSSIFLVALTLSPRKPNRESQSFLPPTPTFACTWRTHWCILCKTFCHWISFYWLRLWEHWDRILWVRLIWPHGSDHPHASYHYKTGHPHSGKYFFQVQDSKEVLDTQLIYLDLPRKAHFRVKARGHGTRHCFVKIHHILDALRVNSTSDSFPLFQEKMFFTSENCSLSSAEAPRSRWLRDSRSPQHSEKWTSVKYTRENKWSRAKERVRLGCSITQQVNLLS